MYGINTLSTIHSVTRVYILEGEKCASAAHALDLAAITSMMGSGQAQEADWAILARYRHIKEFVLVPDNDEPGHKYMTTVFREIQKACPDSKVFVCKLQNMKKGEDLVDWIRLHPACPAEWNGFDSIPKPNSDELQKAFIEYSSTNLIEAALYFLDAEPHIDFESDPELLEEIPVPTLPCPLHTLPDPVIHWVRGIAMQMQISEDYIIAPFLVALGSLIGRKRGLELREGSNWIEYANLWGMSIGRPSTMKSPAMNAAFHPLVVLANRAKTKFEQDIKKTLEMWRIRKKAHEEFKKIFRKHRQSKSKSPMP